MDVAAWHCSLGVGEYATSFVDNKIDVKTMRQLTDDDLKALDVGALGETIFAAAESADTGDVQLVAFVGEAGMANRDWCTSLHCSKRSVANSL